LQFSAGPYFAVGIGGSLKHDFTFEENGREVTSRKYFNESSYKLKPVYGKVNQELYEEFTEDNQLYEMYRAFDFGVNFGLGYKIDGLLFNIGYSLGLVNLNPDYESDILTNIFYGREVDSETYTENFVKKNRVFTFSVAYLFN
jgi:uncharacterized protein YkuJ